MQLKQKKKELIMKTTVAVCYIISISLGGSAEE